MLKLFLWLRYLRKKKIAFLSIAAVTLSVALMVVVDSLFTGYIEGLRGIVVAETGDIFLWPMGMAIPQYRVFLDRLQEYGQIKAAAPFGWSGGLLYLEGGDVREATVNGIDPEREMGFIDWNERLLRQNQRAQPDFNVPGYNDAQGVWLGVNIIAEPNEQTDEYDLEEVEKFIGNKVILTMPGTEGKRRVEKFRVSDIVFTRTFFGDKTLFMPFDELNRIEFGEDEKDKARFVKIKLADGVEPPLMKEVVKKEWEGFASEQLGVPVREVPRVRIMTQQEDRNEFFEDLRNQLRVVLLIFGVICSVAVLLIFCIFYMIVTAKQKDIAIIKSCGASSASAAAIFAGFGACVGIVGSAIGVVLGVVITKNINILEEWVRIFFGMKLWRTSSYGLATIPHQVNWPAVGPIVLAAVLGCVVGVLIPAIIAARTKPVNILRYE